MLAPEEAYPAAGPEFDGFSGAKRPVLKRFGARNFRHGSKRVSEAFYDLWDPS